MAYEDSLYNVGDPSLLIDSSADRREATAASSRSEDLNVAGIQPDEGGEEESVSRGISGCAEGGEKRNSD